MPVVNMVSKLRRQFFDTLDHAKSFQQALNVNSLDFFLAHATFRHFWDFSNIVSETTWGFFGPKSGPPNDRGRGFGMY